MCVYVIDLQLRRVKLLRAMEIKSYPFENKIFYFSLIVLILLSHYKIFLNNIYVIYICSKRLLLIINTRLQSRELSNPLDAISFAMSTEQSRSIDQAKIQRQRS